VFMDDLASVLHKCGVDNNAKLISLDDSSQQGPCEDKHLGGENWKKQTQQLNSTLIRMRHSYWKEVSRLRERLSVKSDSESSSVGASSHESRDMTGMAEILGLDELEVGSNPHAMRPLFKHLLNLLKIVLDLSDEESINHLAAVHSPDEVGTTLTESDFLCRPIRASKNIKLKPISPKSDNQASCQAQRKVVDVFRIAPAFCSIFPDEHKKDFIQRRSVSISKQRCQQQNLQHGGRKNMEITKAKEHEFTFVHKHRSLACEG